MSSDTQRPLTNGTISHRSQTQSEMDELNEQLRRSKYLAKFHGDALIGDPLAPKGFLANLRNSIDDFRRIFTIKNAPSLGHVLGKLLAGQGLDVRSRAQLVGSMPNDSNRRAQLVESQVQKKYDSMLHPPLTYLGDAFQYRTADGKFNSALHPHLGQAGAPYAKTVPSKTHPLGALPDPGDLFDRLMARGEKGRESPSGLSSMLIYHATIIIHDIFRTNDNDKNISDSSSYLDLSPLYGYTEVMVRKIRDDKYKLGLLKPDTFAEDRLLRQPPGVCIMLVMYNRYHNYAATQLRRINENGRFSVPAQYLGPKLVAIAKKVVEDKNKGFEDAVAGYRKAWDEHNANEQDKDIEANYKQATQTLQALIDKTAAKRSDLEQFEKAYDAAWNKLDDDLFNTARLITCGMYIQVSIHDYLRALMGFHQFNTNFTLDPRINMTDHKNVSRGLGNQVTVEFNLLYRFHCAISLKDEKYTEDFMKETIGAELNDPSWNPKSMSLPDFLRVMGKQAQYKKESDSKPTQPWEQTFGLQGQPELNFQRNKITGLFDDQQMISQLLQAMDSKISNFGPRNVPRCLRSVEMLGILQARKWEIGTLNDFRDFFGLRRHDSFESITKNVEIQNALRDLYEHPDKVELYPGVFCESDEKMGVDPGPSDVDSALWSAIFSDAITLVRSDRFYTVDWNTNSLTSWGMKEVTPDNDNLKSSVFHRVLQRAFPEWFPYDSVRFFHPFYTSNQNAKFAQEQGYAADFRMAANPVKYRFGRPVEYEYVVEDSNPGKPSKPLYLCKHNEIKALLSDESDDIVHPARLERRNLPPKIAEVLEPGPTTSRAGSKGEEIEGDSKSIVQYFVSIMRDMVQRQFITMNSERPVYQIDITRDFAIPVTVRYVADFLGFGHRVRSDTNPGAPYSENEIYQHITNCQIFLSYNVDETKLLKPRKAFRSSMKFLFELTQDANVLEASRWSITRWSRDTLGYIWRIGRKRKANPMAELGLRVAKHIIEHEKDSGRAAAILLLTALDSAYNSVLAFTSVLNLFVGELYDVAKSSGAQGPSKSCKWLEVQKLAFEEGPESTEALTKIVLDAQRTSVKLPIIRKAVKSREIKVEGGPTFKIEKGQKVICDLHRAEREAPSASETDYLQYRSSFTEKFAQYHPKHVAVLSLNSMITVLAQMKNLRKGHDAQGRLKKINIDASYEGYANFMAPMCMKKIESDVKAALNGTDERAQDAAKVFDTRILKPSVDTYLTPTWDETVPFSTTWKVRFDGFGPSDYGGNGLPMLQQGSLSDSIPPFYQPQGASHIGGSFADTVCVCSTPGVACRCKKGAATAASSEEDMVKVAMPAEQASATLRGCGVPGEGLLGY